MGDSFHSDLCKSHCPIPVTLHGFCCFDPGCVEYSFVTSMIARIESWRSPVLTDMLNSEAWGIAQSVKRLCASMSFTHRTQVREIDMVAYDRHLSTTGRQGQEDPQGSSAHQITLFGAVVHNLPSAVTL